MPKMLRSPEKRFGVILFFMTVFHLFTNPCYLTANQITLTAEENAFLSKQKTIILAGGISFEPFLIKNPDGTISGYDVDIAQLLKQKTGLEINFELGLWKNIQKRAETGKLDGLSTAGLSKERLSWSNASVPYVTFTTMVFAKKGNPKGIYTVKDFDGKRVALQEGNVLFKRILSSLNSNVEIISYPRINDLLRAIVSGEADFTILDESSLYVARKIGLGSFIETLFPVGEPFGVHFYLKKEWPEALSIINKGLSSFTDKEKIDLRNKWFGKLEEEDLPNKQIFSLSAEEKEFFSTHPTIRVGHQRDLPPFDFSSSGKPQGLSIELIQNLADQIGVKIDFIEAASWNDLLNLFKNKQIDVLPAIFHTKDREQYTLLTESYHAGKLGIFTNDDSDFIVPKLKGLKVGLSASLGNLPIVENATKDSKVFFVKDNIELVKKLATKELDAIIGNPAVIYYITKEYQLKSVNLIDFIELNKEEQQKISWHIGVRHDWPILHQVLQRSLHQIDSKLLADIEDKWTHIAVVKKIDWMIVLQISLVIIVIVTFLIWHNLILRKKVAKRTYDLELLNTNLDSTVQERTQKLIEVNSELEETINELKTLRGIVPICASCKNIRDDEGAWNLLEAYISKHSMAEFSHSICPDCLKELYPDIDIDEEE